MAGQPAQPGRGVAAGAPVLPGPQLQVQKEDAASGVLETDWVENRANLPKDLIRSTIGQVLDACTTAACAIASPSGCSAARTARAEIYIAHHGLEEVYTSRDGNTTWTNRPADPALETELLTRLMQALSPVATAASAASGAASAARRRWCRWPPRPACSAARRVPRWKWTTAWNAPGVVSAWRWTAPASRWRRDRALATYAVRYVDPKIAAQDSPNFISKLFGAKDPAELALGRYRIVLKAVGNGTQVTVQKPNGDPDNSERTAHRPAIGGRTQILIRPTDSPKGSPRLPFSCGPTPHGHKKAALRGGFFITSLQRSNAIGLVRSGFRSGSGGFRSGRSSFRSGGSTSEAGAAAEGAASIGAGASSFLPQAVRAAAAIREASRSDLFMNILESKRVEQKIPVILEARCSCAPPPREVQKCSKGGRSL
jgi:hypothetical protein